jgi:hypothetical protein
MFRHRAIEWRRPDEVDVGAQIAVTLEAPCASSVKPTVLEKARTCLERVDRPLATLGLDCVNEGMRQDYLSDRTNQVIRTSPKSHSGCGIFAP